jgi:predicted DNA-binding WGR domain protein
MLKLYQHTNNELYYWETWEQDEKTAMVHWGIVGQRGAQKQVRSGLFSNFRKTIQREAERKRSEGYTEMDTAAMVSLEVVYSIDGFGTDANLDKRHRLEEHLDDLLGWTGLGHVDGGSTGGGSMEVGCLVVDFETAKRVIEENLKYTVFADYACIYNIAEESAPPQRLPKTQTITHLPQHIKERCYKTIKGDYSITDFERWLYADKELEQLLHADDYLELISLDFKKGGAKYELWNLLKKQIDLGAFETYKMLELLYAAKRKDEKLPYILMDFYDLYCRGYAFLRDLGLGIGLAVEVPHLNNSPAESWDELTREQQTQVLAGFSPELEACIDDAIAWLESGKIILSGEQDDIGHYAYKDRRTGAERQSRIWVTVSEEKTSGFGIKRNTLWDKPGDGASDNLLT